jgi:hypothetical protein
MIRFEVNISPAEVELDRLQHPPTHELESVLAANFATTEARVHVITGHLKASGHPTSEHTGDVWTGTLHFDRDPGIFELARGLKHTKHHGGLGDSHFFFDPVEARWPGDWTTGDSFQMYTKVIRRFIGDDA